jgi:hypothetical protein
VPQLCGLAKSTKDGLPQSKGNLLSSVNRFFGIWALLPSGIVPEISQSVWISFAGQDRSALADHVHWTAPMGASHLKTLSDAKAEIIAVEMRARAEMMFMFGGNALHAGPDSLLDSCFLDAFYPRCDNAADRPNRKPFRDDETDEHIPLFYMSITFRVFLTILLKVFKCLAQPALLYSLKWNRGTF